MGYYIRVLGIQDPNIHVDDLIKELQAAGLSAKFSIEESEQPDQWTFLQIANSKGETLTQIERNPVIEGELGAEELKEFHEEVLEYRPISAATWLNKYFDKVKVIYAFQLLNAAFNDDNYAIIDTIRTHIWNITGGILQADNEGFSNEDGHHILWQFSDNVSDEWSCAVLSGSGHWESFIMELGDETQREEFQQGIVPAKAKR